MLSGKHLIGCGLSSQFALYYSCHQHDGNAKLETVKFFTLGFKLQQGLKRHFRHMIISLNADWREAPDTFTVTKEHFLELVNIIIHFTRMATAA